MTPDNPFSPPRPVFRAEDLVCFCFHYTRAQIEAGAVHRNCTRRYLLFVVG